MQRLAFVLALSSFALACGDDPVGALDATSGTDSGGRADARPMDASAPDLGVRDQGTADLGDASNLDAESPDAESGDAEEGDAQDTDAAEECVPNAVCATNPGAPCRAGIVLCSGQGPVCIDDQAAADGTSCPSGSCVSGACLAPTTISQDVNLSEDAVAPNRSCAEAPQYSVVGLQANQATLTATPTPDCLAVGDEVLLINLQGAPAQTDNVGVWELLEVAQISPLTVTFTNAKTRFYGNAAGTDQGIGVGLTDQKVALIRVPKFGALTIESDVLVTARPWDGLLGGVVAIRSASLEANGRISARGLGYRAGRWSRDSDDCDDNVATESGESITGLGSQTTTRNAGAPGGLGALDDTIFWGNSPLSASAGHATAGEPGQNPVGRTLGEPGASYGVSDGTRLTMGSGASGNLTCDTLAPEPVLIPSFAGVTAGGIVVLLSGDISVGLDGALDADARSEIRDVSASGGYVFLSGRDLDLGDLRVSARGGIGQSVNIAGPVNMNASSPGYVVVEHRGTVTGTTTPVATLIAR